MVLLYDVVGRMFFNSNPTEWIFKDVSYDLVIVAVTVETYPPGLVIEVVVVDRAV